jgi:hypothetical protein
MIDRKLCTPGFGYFRPWRCPACGQGTLEWDRKNVRHTSDATIDYGINEGYLQRSRRGTAKNIMTRHDQAPPSAQHAELKPAAAAGFSAARGRIGLRLRQGNLLLRRCETQIRSLVSIEPL